MVDVSEKPVTNRTATAKGSILVSDEVITAILNGTAKKGDVLGVARVAGIMGVKQTSSLIPLCHTLLILKCSIDFETDPEQGRITATCTVQCAGQTGVEMEALTGVSTALLTIYDMCKAMDRSMEITNIHLVEKSGGKSGHFVNSQTGTDL
ncbi:MAG: cyclic pyranopterin monophosphate synthase MoaC [Clostridiales bacterium]|nr:cyclic pyranopterin monophosphate synthase MoaC [Clostridiales bacterium]